MMAFLASLLSLPAQLEIPAHTTYVDSPADGARVSRDGVSRWNNNNSTITWFGQLKATGQLEASLRIRLQPNRSCRLKFTVASLTTTPSSERRSFAQTPHTNQKI